MPVRLGPTELGIILVIVVLLFGVGRIGRLGADMGLPSVNSAKLLLTKMMKMTVKYRIESVVG